MPGNLGPRSTPMTNIPLSGVQQPSGNLSGGCFTSNSIPIALPQISHGSSQGQSGLTNRGGMSAVGSHRYSNNTNGVGTSIPGILPTSAQIGNRIGVPGSGVSPILGNAGQRISSSVGHIVGGNNIGRSMNSGGGLSLPGFASRLNLSASSGSVSLNVQGPNRLMGGALQRASQQVISMLGGNSNPSAGVAPSQNHVQAVNSLNSLEMMNDVNSNASPSFDSNDFPQLTSHPSSSGGSQGHIGSLQKQGFGVSPIVQQNQEFSMQNEDFPALPGFKGGNADFVMDLHQKEQFDQGVSMMQSSTFSMGRSAGFNIGGAYSSHGLQRHQYAQSLNGSGISFSSVNNQEIFPSRGSDLFLSSFASCNTPVQNTLPQVIGLRPPNSINAITGLGAHDQFVQQYQQHNQSQFRLQQMSAVGQSNRDQGMKFVQATQAAPGQLDVLGLLNVIRMRDPYMTSLAIGMDLTTLGLNLNSSEDLHKTFGSPWSHEPAKGDPDFTVPQCYNADESPPLNQVYFSKFRLDTLFYIFYSMPKDEAQLYAANELCNRGWFYHREHRLWYTRVTNMEPLLKTNAYERGSYFCFDPSIWRTFRKDNFVVQYEMLEKRPALSQH